MHSLKFTKGILSRNHRFVSKKTARFRFRVLAEFQRDGRRSFSSSSASTESLEKLKDEISSFGSSEGIEGTNSAYSDSKEVSSSTKASGKSKDKNSAILSIVRNFDDIEKSEEVLDKLIPRRMWLTCEVFTSLYPNLIAHNDVARVCKWYMMLRKENQKEKLEIQDLFTISMTFLKGDLEPSKVELVLDDLRSRSSELSAENLTALLLALISYPNDLGAHTPRHWLDCFIASGSTPSKEVYKVLMDHSNDLENVERSLQEMLSDGKSLSYEDYVPVLAASLKEKKFESFRYWLEVALGNELMQSTETLPKQFADEILCMMQRLPASIIVECGELVVLRMKESGIEGKEYKETAQKICEEYFRSLLYMGEFEKLETILSSMERNGKDRKQDMTPFPNIFPQGFDKLNIHRALKRSNRLEKTFPRIKRFSDHVIHNEIKRGKFLEGTAFCPYSASRIVQCGGPLNFQLLDFVLHELSAHINKHILHPHPDSSKNFFELVSRIVEQTPCLEHRMEKGYLVHHLAKCISTLYQMPSKLSKWKDFKPWHKIAILIECSRHGDEQVRKFWLDRAKSLSISYDFPSTSIDVQINVIEEILGARRQWDRRERPLPPYIINLVKSCWDVTRKEFSQISLDRIKRDHWNIVMYHLKHHWDLREAYKLASKLSKPEKEVFIQEIFRHSLVRDVGLSNLIKKEYKLRPHSLSWQEISLMNCPSLHTDEEYTKYIQSESFLDELKGPNSRAFLEHLVEILEAECRDQPITSVFNLLKHYKAFSPTYKTCLKVLEVYAVQGKYLKIKIALKNFKESYNYAFNDNQWLRAARGDVSPVSDGDDKESQNEDSIAYQTNLRLLSCARDVGHVNQFVKWFESIEKKNRGPAYTYREHPKVTFKKLSRSYPGRAEQQPEEYQLRALDALLANSDPIMAQNLAVNHRWLQESPSLISRFSLYGHPEMAMKYLQVLKPTGIIPYADLYASTAAVKDQRKVAKFNADVLEMAVSNTCSVMDASLFSKRHLREAFRERFKEQASHLSMIQRKSLLPRRQKPYIDDTLDHKEVYRHFIRNYKGDQNNWSFEVPESLNNTSRMNLLRNLRSNSGEKKKMSAFALAKRFYWGNIEEIFSLEEMEKILEHLKPIMKYNPVVGQYGRYLIMRTTHEFIEKDPKINFRLVASFMPVAGNFPSLHLVPDLMRPAVALCVIDCAFERFFENSNNWSTRTKMKEKKTVIEFRDMILDHIQRVIDDTSGGETKLMTVYNHIHKAKLDNQSHSSHWQVVIWKGDKLMKSSRNITHAGKFPHLMEHWLTHDPSYRMECTRTFKRMLSDPDLRKKLDVRQTFALLARVFINLCEDQRLLKTLKSAVGDGFKNEIIRELLVDRKASSRIMIDECLSCSSSHLKDSVVSFPALMDYFVFHRLLDPAIKLVRHIQNMGIEVLHLYAFDGVIKLCAIHGKPNEADYWIRERNNVASEPKPKGEDLFAPVHASSFELRCVWNLAAKGLVITALQNLEKCFQEKGKKDDPNVRRYYSRQAYVEKSNQILLCSRTLEDARDCLNFLKNKDCLVKSSNEFVIHALLASGARKEALSFALSDAPSISPVIFAAYDEVESAVCILESQKKCNPEIVLHIAICILNCSANNDKDKRIDWENRIERLTEAQGYSSIMSFAKVYFPRGSNLDLSPFLPPPLSSRYASELATFVVAATTPRKLDEIEKILKEAITPRQKFRLLLGQTITGWAPTQVAQFAAQLQQSEIDLGSTENFLLGAAQFQQSSEEKMTSLLQKAREDPGILDAFPDIFRDEVIQDTTSPAATLIQSENNLLDKYIDALKSTEGCYSYRTLAKSIGLLQNSSRTNDVDYFTSLALAVTEPHLQESEANQISTKEYQPKLTDNDARELMNVCSDPIMMEKFFQLVQKPCFDDYIDVLESYSTAAMKKPNAEDLDTYAANTVDIFWRYFSPQRVKALKRDGKKSLKREPELLEAVLRVLLSKGLEQRLQTFCSDVDKKCPIHPLYIRLQMMRIYVMRNETSKAEVLMKDIQSRLERSDEAVPKYFLVQLTRIVTEVLRKYGHEADGSQNLRHRESVDGSSPHAVQWWRKVYANLVPDLERRRDLQIQEDSMRMEAKTKRGESVAGIAN